LLRYGKVHTIPIPLWETQHLTVQSTPTITPPSLCAHTSQCTEIPYCTVFRFSTTFDIQPLLATATNCGAQTVVLYQGLTVVPLVGYGENTRYWVQIYLHGCANSKETAVSLPFTR